VSNTTRQIFADLDIQQVQAPHEAAIAAEIALLALGGHIVYRCKARDFIVSKYGTMTKYCEDFAELQAFSRRLGVTK